jgi:hypothetical protein
MAGIRGRREQPKLADPVAQAARDHMREVKRAQRIVLAERKKFDKVLAQDPIIARQTVWDKNRALLSTEELSSLTLRQQETACLASFIQEFLDVLPLPPSKFLKMGSEFDGPDGVGGLMHLDYFFLDCLEFIARTNPNNRVIFTPSPAEFVDAHKKCNQIILDSFTEADFEYFKYGFICRLRTAQWESFVDAIKVYIDTHCDENIEFEIAAQIIELWHSSHPWVRNMEERRTATSPVRPSIGVDKQMLSNLRMKIKKEQELFGLNYSGEI